MAEQDKVLQQLKRVLLELRDTRKQLQDAEYRDHEPIAIVGMSCRFPGGADSPARLWELVDSGRDAVGEFPPDRGWDLDNLFDPDPDHPGTTYARHGSFVYDAGEFDPGFFSISPREALAMDPQQRLLLQGAWEAFEHAGIAPTSLKGSQTGVFVGVSSSNYGVGPTDAAGVEGLRLTGTIPSVASGRLAYTFGLVGPAVSVDTACSSSLVALHLAAQALRRGECDMALAGGATVMATPGLFIEFSRQRGLSVDGRCKAFGAGADGTGWSEGAGLLVLERLSEARAKGHEVLAVVRGSAVNQDGASNGLTAPNGPSQERVIRQALASAGLSPSDVDAVEGHGTGTTLGDPIEAEALLATYGRDRANGPLRLGSIKSNLGHSAAAAGVGGVIKMVEALRHGVLPRSLHCEEPSPHVDWSAGAVELLREPVEWPAGERVRRAGISSFGVSGTNAHVIVEEAPEAEEAAAAVPASDGALPFLVSAATPAALAVQAERIAEAVEGQDPYAVAAALANRRAHLPHRAVVVAADAEELVSSLRALDGAVQGTASRSGGVAFLFSGQGAQWPGMGAELYAQFPVFAEAFDEVCGELAKHLDRPLREVVFGSDAELLADTRFTQTALFALEVSLFRLLESFGIRPDHLIGHSIGEFAAAHVAGVFSLADGARLVAERGRLMGELPAGGAMLAIEATEDEVRAQLPASLSIAAVNGSRAVVVSGPEDAIAQAEELWSERRTTRLRVSHAFHSALMEPMLDELKAVAQQVTFADPKIPIVSNVTGRQLTADEARSPEYWVRHVRETVRFADGVQALREAGVTSFLELGPDGTLTALAANDEGLYASSQRGRKGPQRESFLSFLGAAHCAGIPVDWRPLLDDTGIGRVELPTYAFQREHFWLEGAGGPGDLAAAGQAPAEHPLLGATVRLAGDGEGWLFTGRLSLASHPWLADHAVMGTVLLPGTAFVELALAAAERTGADEVEDLTLVAPLVLASDGAVALQVTVGEADESGRRPVNIYSSPQSDEPGAGDWTLHASGLLGPGDAAERLDSFADATWPPEGAEEVDVESFYDRAADAGYDYGPAFQGLRKAYRDGDAWLAEVTLDAEHEPEAGGFCVHPALADAALHTLLLAALDGAEPGASPEVPFSFSGVRLHAHGAAALRVRVETGADGAARLLALDQEGATAFAIDALGTRAVDTAALGSKAPAGSDSLFAVDWVEVAATGDEPVVAALADAMGDDSSTPDVVLAHAPAPEGDLVAGVHDAAAQTLTMLKEFLETERLADAKLVLVTDRALAVSGDESPNLAHAALLGLMRTAASENPLRFGVVDTDGGELPAAALASDEPELAVRAGRVLAPRLTRAHAEAAAAAPDPDGTVLITGGTGGLGALVARHLASAHGARRLLLTSRRGMEAEGAAGLVAELKELGCEAEVAACDVADRAQVEALLAQIPADHPLTAVMHAAGVLDDGILSSLDPDRLRGVMAPKVDGAIHLHELTAGLDLWQFVLFSSVASTFGSPGQGNYAAANAFLDALAQHRQAQGLPATALAWGAWERGMAGELSDADRARTERMGMAALSDQDGLELFDTARAAAQPLLVPVGLDTAALRGQAKAGVLPAILRGLVRVPARRAADASGSLARRLADVPPPEAEAIVLELVRGHVASVLGHSSPDAIDPQQNFKDLGFDSLSAVEMRNRLIQATGVKLPTTVVFDHPSPAAVAEYLRSKVAGAERESAPSTPRRKTTTDEPIAIVGMSARYPGGVRSPDDLWRLVSDGRDAIGGFPDDRGWDLERLYDPDPETPRTSYTREGGFLYEAGEFDAGFFGIGPREALATDPQQRLLLEATWEALEDAGIDPDSLRGSDTGVYAGVMYGDYGFAGFAGALEEDVEGYLGIGSAGSVVSGRLSYTFGFEGPAMTIDTACSSSLVALHLAARSLRAGESSLAIAGGVTVLANPTVFVEFSRQRGLSADGRCKSYGASADGVGWAEGAGLLVLERLSDARRNGHRVLGLVRGSAVNQDGASNGLTAPNGPSQERVIREALASAGLSPADVDVVEGHGTGTSLGDPIEAQALLETYGQERSDGPLRLGSIKSNIGHTQAAAGVAGVIKVVEAMRHGMLPPSLHCGEPSPHVDWSAGEVRLLAEAEPWERNGRVRRAGVSSFGISGTNAHVIVEEPPAAPPRERSGDGGLPAVPFLISGRGEAAVREQAERLRAWLAERPELEPADVAFSLATARAHLERRAVVVGAGREELLAGLEGLASGEVPVGGALSGKTAFLFTGQGAQWAGMGSELYGAFPAFAAALDATCEELDPHLGRSLKELMFGDDAATLARTEYTQAAVFAIEVALFRLFEAWTVRPDFLVGHSIGELAAAHVAGVLSLADAAKLVAARGRLMGALPEGGAMLAVEASADEIESGGLSLAAVNGPRAVVLSGEVTAIDAAEAQWRERGRKTSRLKVSHAFHSHLMEPMLDEFRAVAEGLTFDEPRVAVVSNLTGAVTKDELADPEYWVRHVREAVRFADGIAELERLGVTRFVEIGPDGVLSAMARGSVSEELADRAAFVPAQRANRDQAKTLVGALGSIHDAGVALDWQAFFAGSGAHRVDLPTYAFQRERFWLTSSAKVGDLSAAGLGEVDHPLIGAAVHMAGSDEWLFTDSWSLATHPWLADHAVFDTVIVPGTAFAELAMRVGREVGCELIEELTIEAPLQLPEHGAVQVQVTVGEPGDGGQREIGIYSRAPGEADGEVAEWTRHAAGLLALAPEQSSDATADRLAGESWPPEGADPLDVDDLYDRLADSGYGYGPAFQGVTDAWRRGEEVFAQVALDDEDAERAARFGIHPALFDSSFHALMGILIEEFEAGKVPLPFSWSGVRLLNGGNDGGPSALRVSLMPQGAEGVRLTALDERGTPALVVEMLASRMLDASKLAAARGAAAKDDLFVLTWDEISLAPPNGDPSRLAAIGDVPGDLDHYADAAALIAAIEAGEPVPDVVVASVPSEDGADEAAAAHGAVHHALELLQAWLAEERLADTRLVIATRAAVALSDAESPDVAAAAVWGLVRSAAAENPGRFLSVDLGRDEAAGDVAWLPLLAVDEPQLAVREGRAFAPRLTRAAATAEPVAPSLDPAGTVLITGGTGGLGALMARHLAAGGARHLLLASRRGADAKGASELAAELETLGSHAQVEACDFGDREAVSRLLQAIPAERPLTAVIHTAGVMEDGTIPSLTPDGIDRVMVPKVDATLHLHELTKESGLAEFVLFSSAAPLLGGAGQGSYAAANAALDALAQRRRAEGLPARSLAWGLWGVASGMADLSEEDLERAGRAIRARLGLVPMPAEQGLELFDRARSIDAPVVVPAPLDTGVLRAQARAGIQPAVLRGLVRAPARRERQGGGGGPASLLAGRPEAEWDAILVEMVRGHLAAVLGHDSVDAVDPERNMLELGLDSLGAVELRNRLSHSTGLRIPPTVAFDSPTAQALATYLGERVRAESPDPGNASANRNSAAATRGGTLTTLLRQAAEDGALVDFVPVLTAASQFRPAFASASDLDKPPTLTSLSRGELPQLICVPSFLAGSGPHQFARLASGFGDGGRSLSAFSLPGFKASEAAPATWAAAIDALALSVREAVGDDPFVLVGYSIGGALAHALAARLEDDGLFASGLVMIDTYAPATQDEMSEVFAGVMATVLEQGHELIQESVDDENIMAMGTYMRLLGEFDPQPIEAPSMLVRASDRLGDAFEAGRLPWWQMPPDVLQVTGHHFGLIDESAGETARVIDEWVREKSALSRPAAAG